MNRNIWLVCCFLLFTVHAWPQVSRADYIGLINVGLGGQLRMRDDGTFVPNGILGLPHSISSNIESYDEAVALSPDLKKTYLFVDTLGFSNYVIASDTNTGQFLPNDTLALPLSTPPQNENYILQARQPLIKGNDLYVLSAIDLRLPIKYQIKHYDLATKAFVDTISPPSPQTLDDIALGSSLFGPTLYVSSPAGIYAYSGGPNFNSLPPDLFLPGVEGNLAIGPDNLLYVRNFANGDVQRYTQLGTFVDTFISHTNFPNLRTIQFGFDGNLHAYQEGFSASNILTFSGTSGALIFSTPNHFVNGRITYVPPVPEPATTTLFGVCIVALFKRRPCFRRNS
jgi:hypothetical protein